VANKEVVVFSAIYALKILNCYRLLQCFMTACDRGSHCVLLWTCFSFISKTIFRNEFAL